MRVVNRVRLAWALLCLLLIPIPTQSYSLWQLSILARGIAEDRRGIANLRYPPATPLQRLS